MATKYAIPAGGNWDSDTTWSTTSGGVNDTTKPTDSDDVILNSSSGNVTINATANARRLDTNGYTGVLTHNSGITLNLGHSTLAAGSILLRLVATMTYTRASSFNCPIVIKTGSGNQWQIYLGGQTLSNATMEGFNVSSPNVILMDTFNCNYFEQRGGIFTTNNQAVNCIKFTQAGGNGRTVNLGSSTVTLSASSDTAWDANNATVNAGTSRIIMTGSNATFSGRGRTYNEVEIIGTGTAVLNQNNVIGTLTRSGGNLSITGSNTITTFTYQLEAAARTLTLTAGTNNTVTNWNVNGSSGNLITIQSSSGGVPATITKTSGVLSSNYLNLIDITATGGATFYAGSNSTNGGGNTGWLFNTYFTQTFTESITLTETLTKSLTRTISESISLTETLIKAIAVVAFVETITLTETLQRQTAKICSDTLSLTETLQRSVTKTLTDGMSLVETLIKAIRKTFYGQSVQNYLAMEQGGYLLTEDGGKLIIEGGAVVYGETLQKHTVKTTFTEVVTLIETFINHSIRKFPKNKLLLKIKQRITHLR